ncbi:MAG TPA: hypothetical protein VHR15_19615 [Ktedonobacterales bacterium]|jgi:hypothetical protein|nr:hypothetical protein [Ktedonobacterales bacterium]
MPTAFDQADAAALYEQMRPDQRTAIALEFVRCLRLAGDPAADQFTAEAQQTETSQQGSVAEEQVVVTGGALETPRLLSAQQAAAVHRYTFERHPDCFTEVLHHPLTQAVLAAPGEPPAQEENVGSDQGALS